MKIEEVLAKITLSQHKLEVYNDIEAYLDDYLPNDTGSAPETLVVSDDIRCLDSTVSYEALETILGEIQKLKSSEEGTLKALNAMEATNGKPKRKPPARKQPKSAGKPRATRRTTKSGK